MADQKISELVAAGALTGAELVPVVQGGATVQTTAQDIADLGGGGGGMTPGDLVLLVPTDAADFTAALAIAEASSYSGRVIIRFEAGYTLTEPLLFDGVQKPNIDIDCSLASPMSVDTTTFPPAFGTPFRAVLALRNSHIGRVYGTCAVTAGDGPDLCALLSLSSSYTVGAGTPFAPIPLVINGTTNGGNVLGSYMLGEGGLTIPTTGSGALEFVGGGSSGIDFTFGGTGVQFRQDDTGGNQHAFGTLTLTGASCAVDVVSGQVDFGRVTIAPYMPLQIHGAYGAIVRGQFAAGSIAVNLGDAVIKSTFRSDVSFGTVGIFEWQTATGGRFVHCVGSRVAFGSRNAATLSVDTGIATPDYIVYVESGADVLLDVDDILGSGWGSISNVPVNAVHPYSTAANEKAGCLVRLSTSTGGAAEDVWAAPTLLNSWTNIAGAQAAQYRMIGDMVQVRMAIEDGIAATLFTLPVGFRPPADIGLPAQVHDNTSAPDFGHLRIESDGDVILEHPGTLSNHQVWATFEFSVTV